ncbi:MAG: hypothetical protein KAS90_03380 [Candidatus Aenigmarchaeota archaeon]|nr:hypothetical protein [Candidatus Aenigmarchaeota archaeon]
MAYFNLIVPVLLAAVLGITITSGRHREYHWRISFWAVFISLGLLLMDFSEIMSAKIITYNMLGWNPPLGICFAVDLVGYLVMSLVAVTALAALAISRTEIHKDRKEFYALFLLLFLGLAGASMTGDIFNLFVFFEILSIASYALVSYSGRVGSVASSVRFLVMGSFATSLILLGIAFIYGSLGTLNIADISRSMSLSSTTASLAGFGLLLCGFSFKAAVAPFHAWKPSVIRYTPLSLGLMFTAGGVTIGLYTIFRLAATISGLDISSLLIFLSLLTMVVGAVLALQTHNLKKLLAYSAISQSGYVLFGLGIGSYTGALYHLVNLVIIDMLLFVASYVVISHLKTSNLDRMGGLGSGNPLLLASFAVGALSLAGLPLFNGFSSKLIIYTAGLEVFPVGAIVAMLVSVLTLAYCSKMMFMIFFSNMKGEGRINLGVDIKFILVILAIVCIAFGVLQAPVTDVMAAIAGSGLDRELYIRTVLGLGGV